MLALKNFNKKVPWTYSEIIGASADDALTELNSNASYYYNYLLNYTDTGISSGIGSSGPFEYVGKHIGNDPMEDQYGYDYTYNTYVRLPPYSAGCLIQYDGGTFTKVSF